MWASGPERARKNFNYVYSESDVMHPAAVGPFACILDQTFAHWIFLRVCPLLRIVLIISQPAMKTTDLKSTGACVRFSQSVFPKFNPALDCEFQISRRT